MSELSDTLPGALARQASERPGEVALRHKRLGRWVELTWGDYADAVARTAAGLQRIGVGGGERVLIQADNRPEWVIADLAVQAIGAVTVALSPDADAAALGAVLGHSGACVVVAEDEEQLDKLAAVRDAAPLVRKVVVIDERGIAPGPEVAVVGWRELAGGDPADLAGLAGALEPSDPAVALYAGEAHEGAMLDHAALVAAGRGFASAFEAVPGDSVLSVQPLSELAERLLSIAIALESGYVVHFGERVGSVGDDLREVQPTLLHGVSGSWQALYDEVARRMATASGLKRRVFAACLRRGPGLLTSVLAFGALREKLGLSRVRIAVSSGSPLAPAARDGLAAMGVTLVEVQALDAAGMLGSQEASL